MQAAVRDVYGPPEVVAVRDVERPEPRADEVLVKVCAAGVGPEVWHLMAGLPYAVRLVYGLRRPRDPVLGWDLAGRVESVGAKATAWKPGDEVFGAGVGTFAEYARAKATLLAAKPGALSYEQAAAIPVSAQTALQALRDKGRVRAGQRVLVIGASGGVGSYAVQLAVAFDTEVTGVCGPGGIGHVKALGAAEVIDYTREDVTDRDGRYDVVLDAAGNRPLSRLRRVLTPHGRLVLIGGEGGGRVLGMGRALKAQAMSPFLRQDLGSFLAKTRAADLDTLAGLIETGKLKPVIDRVLPLTEAADAIRHLREGHPHGKIVLTVAES